MSFSAESLATYLTHVVFRRRRACDFRHRTVTPSLLPAPSRVCFLLRYFAHILRILSLPKLERNRHTGSGAVDSMAEALLLSRADIFVRLVVGTTGFSTFAYLSNALRSQGDWAAALPPLRREGFVRCNYVVTSKCGTEHRCFEAPVEVRMADVSWHGKFVTGRSCGDVIARLNQKIGCDGLTPIGGDATEEEEL
ncbi:unnamed protein product [Durusdinium trenchii]|uniref:Uncharacterized protein n=1 Tax=Durusdinium trenchii TaxID=1381693 RepID=A0ABP0R450_9DINO